MVGSSGNPGVVIYSVEDGREQFGATSGTRLRKPFRKESRFEDFFMFDHLCRFGGHVQVDKQTNQDGLKGYQLVDVSE